MLSSIFVHAFLTQNSDSYPFSGFKAPKAKGMRNSVRGFNETTRAARFGGLSRRDSRTQPRVSTLGTRKITRNRPERAEDLEFRKTPDYSMNGVPWTHPDQELATPPQHLTVVGPKDDPAAKALFAAAIKQPATYKAGRVVG